LHYAAWKSIADREGIEFDREVNERLRGVSRMESLEIILEKAGNRYTQDEKLSMASEKNDLYVTFLDSLTPSDVLPGVKEALEKLKALGVLIAIGSSSRNARKILRMIGMEDSFDAVADGNSISKSKPDPEVFIKAANLLGVPCQECVVVEDAVAGIDAALAMGAKTVAVGYAASCGKAHFHSKDLTGLNWEELLAQFDELL
jgi:beta-phosphoglucomutase